MPTSSGSPGSGARSPTATATPCGSSRRCSTPRSPSSARPPPVEPSSSTCSCRSSRSPTIARRQRAGWPARSRTSRSPTPWPRRSSRSAPTRRSPTTCATPPIVGASATSWFATPSCSPRSTARLRRAGPTTHPGLLPRSLACSERAGHISPPPSGQWISATPHLVVAPAHPSLDGADAPLLRRPAGGDPLLRPAGRRSDQADALARPAPRSAWLALLQLAALLDGRIVGLARIDDGPSGGDELLIAVAAPWRCAASPWRSAGRSLARACHAGIPRIVVRTSYRSSDLRELGAALGFPGSRPRPRPALDLVRATEPACPLGLTHGPAWRRNTNVARPRGRATSRRPTISSSSSPAPSCQCHLGDNASIRRVSSSSSSPHPAKAGDRQHGAAAIPANGFLRIV